MRQTFGGVLISSASIDSGLRRDSSPFFLIANTWREMARSQS
jgi:hypothetical protein